MGLAMKRINISELHEFSAKSLGLDATSLDLTSVEGIAGALRRAAGFYCPCTEQELIANVFQSVRDLVSSTQQLRHLIDATLQALLAYGDLVECRMPAVDTADGPNTLLYLTPPSFVARRDGSVFLLGIAPDDLSPLPAQYLARIEHDGHVRRMQPIPEENLRLCLGQFGLWELPLDQWLRTPSAEPAREYLFRFNQRLATAPSAGSIPDLRMLDPSKSVRFYPERWMQLRNQSGKFVGRRPQAYGADLWCYVEIDNGQIQRLLDLPQFEKRWRPCDEAWRLQSAIDASNSQPQHYRVRPGPTKQTSVLDLLSPVPLWAQRRWDLTGHPTPRSGSLFSYVLPASVMKEELHFLETMLWLINSREVG
jgi:hypothetical protein